MLRLQIKELAEAQGLNRNRLQLKCGVTMPLLTRYWKNETGSVTLEALEKIARALNVKAIDLFVEVESDQEEK